MKPTNLTIKTSHNYNHEGKIALPLPPSTHAHSHSYTLNRKPLLLTILTLAFLSTLSILYVQPAHSPLSLSSLHLSTTRTQIKTFTPNPAYNDLSPAADGNWTNLVPPNGGFFRQKVGGRSGGPGEDHEMVGLTMFHQLHCLGLIRGALQDAKVGEKRTNMREKKQVVEEWDTTFGVRRRAKRGSVEREESRKADDYLHCFDYLVQTILCNADATQEPAREAEDGRRAVDGYNIQHQCRSADAVWATVMGTNSVPGWRLREEDQMQNEFDLMERRYS